MNGTSYTCLLLVFILLLLIKTRNRKQTEKYIEAKTRRKNGDKIMKELAERLIGKDILVKTVGSESMADGILKEVTDNAMVIEKNGQEVFVNLDYVIRIREYPKGKNGKRKTLLFDE